jgi:UDP-glucose 4-epimerase
MINLLIIGSKGFIGRHVNEYFAAQKEFSVYRCDVAVDYTDEHYFQVDAANADYQDIFQQVPFDVCLNCSGAAVVSDSLVHPYRDFLLNTVNVYKLLEAIRRYRPACHFINLSSAAVYGNPSKLPVQEKDSCQPLSPYGSHKAQAEVICKEFSRHFGIKACSLRIFSAFGEGLQKQLFWDISQKIKHTNDNTITLFGTGKESRDFIYVKDIARIIGLMILNRSSIEDCYNVASGIETTIKEAVELFLDLMEWRGRIEFNGSSREGDPINWRADVSRISSLGFTPGYSLKEGLKRYAAWIKERE